MKDLRDEIKKAKQEIDVVTKILDEDNLDNIMLYDENGKEIEFEQVAVVVVDDKYYAIMLPLTSLPGIEEGSGVLFYINEETRDLENVIDEEIIDKAFKVYQDLIGEGK